MVKDTLVDQDGNRKKTNVSGLLPSPRSCHATTTICPMLVKANDTRKGLIGAGVGRLELLVNIGRSI